MISENRQNHSFDRDCCTRILPSTIMKPATVTSQEKDFFDFGGFGGRWKIKNKRTGHARAFFGRPSSGCPPRSGGSLHYHHNEDEYSFVLRGTLGALLGDDVVTAKAGTWVVKPREQWHTFWNLRDDPSKS